MLFKVYIIGSKCVQAFKFIVCVVFGTKIYMDIVGQWDLIQILFSLCIFVHFGKRFHYVVCVSQGRDLTLCTPIMVHTIRLNITQNGKKIYSGKQFLFRIGTTCFASFVDGTLNGDSKNIFRTSDNECNLAVFELRNVSVQKDIGILRFTWWSVCYVIRGLDKYSSYSSLLFGHHIIKVL